MKITCETIADFVKNLPDVPAELYRGTVYYNRSRRPIRAENHRGAPDTSFEVIYQVSTVLQFKDGGQALLEAGEFCGTDRETADGGTDGTDRLNELHNKILDYCLMHDMKTMPGLVDAN